MKNYIITFFTPTDFWPPVALEEIPMDKGIKIHCDEKNLRTVLKMCHDLSANFPPELTPSVEDCPLDDCPSNIWKYRNREWKKEDL